MYGSQNNQNKRTEGDVLDKLSSKKVQHNYLSYECFVHEKNMF
jgi:hypothetical protein